MALLPQPWNNKLQQIANTTEEGYLSIVDGEIVVDEEGSSADAVKKSELDTPGNPPSLNIDGDQYGIVQSRIVSSSQAQYAIPMEGETVVVVNDGAPVSLAIGGEDKGILSKNCVDGSIHAMLHQAVLTTITLNNTNRNDLELPSYYKMIPIGGTVNFTGMTIPGHNYPFEIYLVVRSGTVTVKHQSTESLANNRFICNTAADIILTVNEWARVIRDPFQNRWRISKW